MICQASLIFLLLSVLFNDSLQKDAECNCVELKHCQQFISGQKDLPYCSPTTVDPSKQRVCCPKDVGQSGGSESSTIMTSPESIASLKCAEYGEAVFQQVGQNRPNSRKMDLCFQEPQILTYAPELAQYPHLAQIGFGTEKKWLCTGSLISDNFVLSSARCSMGPKHSGQNTELWVKVGEKEDTQIIQVIKRIIHPSFAKLSNDIALLQLANPVKFGRTSRPACLHTNTQIPTEFLVAAAWINNKYDAEHFEVMTDNRRLLQGQTCSTALKKMRVNITSQEETTICSSTQLRPSKNQDFSQPGYPVQMRLSKPYCMFGLVGLSSIPLVHDPLHVDTRVSHYVPWIQQIVWPDTSL